VVGELRKQYQAPIVFIGDGVTDLNGALNADLVFARSHLARLFDDMGHAYTPYETFDDVLTELFISHVEVLHDEITR